MVSEAFKMVDVGVTVHNQNMSRQTMFEEAF